MSQPTADQMLTKLAATAVVAVSAKRAQAAEAAPAQDIGQAIADKTAVLTETPTQAPRSLTQEVISRHLQNKMAGQKKVSAVDKVKEILGRFNKQEA